jgi:hypothetical protein
LGGRRHVFVIAEFHQSDMRLVKTEVASGGWLQDFLVLILTPGVAPDSLSSDPPTLGFLGFLGFQYPPRRGPHQRDPGRRSQLGQVLALLEE